MQLFYRLARPVLFLLPAEAAHHLTLRILLWFARLRNGLLQGTDASVSHPSQILGVSVGARVGLAPGFVKHPKYAPVAAVMGFGFAEIGTLTRLPQSGNRQPRMFRLKRDQALINRLGFNNPGFHNAKWYLRRSTGLPVAINLGKNKSSPPEALLDELCCGIHLFTDVANWFVLNVSSPNTSGLRALLDPAALDRILAELKVQRARAAKFYDCPVRPLLIKLHPDLDADRRQELLAWLPQADIDGVIATNTTVRREGLKTPKEIIDQIGPGGLSGPPLANVRDQLIIQLKEVLPADKAVIAVGGVDSVSQAQRCLQLGADAVEVYTGLIYQGPGLIRQLAKL